MLPSEVISKIDQNFSNFTDFLVREDYKNRFLIYFTADIPIELISAADLIPLRIPTEINSFPRMKNIDSMVQPFNCAKSRQLLDFIINNAEIISGGIFSESYCDSLQNLVDILEMNNSLPDSFQSFRFLLPVRRGGMNETKYYFEEVKRLYVWFEGRSGPSSADKLRKSILLYNRKRKLMGELAGLLYHTKLTLGEYLKLKNGCDTLPIDESVKLLEDFIAELSDEIKEPVKTPKILLSGSMFDNSNLFEKIPILNDVIVANDLSFGSRSNSFEIKLGDDDSLDEMLKNLAEAYIQQRIPDSVHFPSDLRKEYLLKQIDTYQIQGVIFLYYGFCDPDTFESRNLSRLLEGKGIPTLTLETDPQLTNTAQLTTRVEAFLEKIGE
ncbi:MAG: 2-hydroxyacyl-CoA dehydratase subunit D [Candidatus Kariarchaeaceae archaeon]|jgi:benzoyl-CoA reductase/2-hydroxyglutaryl-CoA dehydratase subunit BcrC/BadD/HgdB